MFRLARVQIRVVQISVGLLYLIVYPTDIITEGPVSVIAPVGENALFHCNGSGFTIAWIVDGISHNDPTIVAQGISDITVSTSSGTIQSTLTVPAISVNNGIVIECRVISFVNGVAISNNATLTVLPGELCWTDTID